MKSKLLFLNTTVRGFQLRFFTLTYFKTLKRECQMVAFLCLPMLVVAQTPTASPKNTPPPVSKPKSNNSEAKAVKTSQKIPSNNPKIAPKKPVVPKKPIAAKKPIKKDQTVAKGAVKKPAVAIPTGDEPNSFRQEMLSKINDLRVKGCSCGNQKMPPVPPLRWNQDLEEAAIKHARDMRDNNFMGHIGTDGSEFDARIDREGYKWLEVGENVARGQMNTHQVMTDWIKSPSHCKTLMNSEFKEVGAARAGNFWVQDFGKPMR
ncbi:MAG: hypothetical protein RL757_1567 [Bacteroidota bacterium]|jgi:uncharacterized protein YkwD